MGSKTRLSSYCTKRGDDTVNLVTSCKTNARLARPIEFLFVVGIKFDSALKHQAGKSNPFSESFI